MHDTRTGRWVAVLTVALTAFALVGAPSASALHTTTPTTYKGHVFNAGASTPSADKPQSKLWFADGSWWGLLLEASGNTTVHELRDHAWRSTGVVVDSRPTSRADALWDGSRLYTASRTASGGLQLNRLSYAPATRAWSVDTGYPRTIASNGSESTTVAKDTRGRLWVTYTQSSIVWVLHSTTDDATWTAPFRLPGADTSVSADDISAVVAFQDKIGVMWSDQASSAFRFAVHPDSAAGTTGWTYETPLAGTNMADDHINIKTLLADGQGRVHAAVKTSQGDGGEGAGSPSIAVLTRSGSGAWSQATAGVVGDSLTRPVLLIDATNARLYLFMTAPESGGTIYYKTAPLSDIRFGNGRGSPFVAWSGAKINNVTTTKDPVNATTGIVVLAAEEATRTYFHAELRLAGTPAPSEPPPPVGTGSIALVGAATGVSSTTSLSVARPAGVAAGHVLLASVDARGGPSVTPPAGWQLVRLDAAGTTMRKATYVKVAGSAEPASYTWSLSSAQSAVVALTAYSGVSTTGPVDAVGGQVGTSSASVVAPSVTTATTGTRLVGLFGIARVASLTSPTGMVERAEATAQATYSVTGEVADETLSASGATGSRTATASGAAVGIGHLVALRPAG